MSEKDPTILKGSRTGYVASTSFRNQIEPYNGYHFDSCLNWTDIYHFDFRVSRSDVSLCDSNVNRTDVYFLTLV